MISNSLKATEYHPYYKAYIDKAASIQIVDGLETNEEKVIAFLSKFPKEKHDYAYASGKWTIKDIVLHIIDTERIFAYRALRIARGDESPLVGFEQDSYVTNGNASKRSIDSLILEYKSVRQSTITLFQGFDDDMLLRIGKASGSAVSVRALGYMITGHENHHLQVLNERYL